MAAVHELFAGQAARAPDAPALIFGRQSLSYGDVDRCSDRFAERLIRLGLGAEDIVAISDERSPEQLIAALGVLKAGGAYTPLDPAYPNERLSAILEEARPTALATRAHHLPRLAAFQGPVIDLGADADADAEHPLAPDRRAIEAHHLAYVIFTSGSTGKPKGVLIEHASLSNHATAMARHYELGPGDRVLQFASLSFDVAAEEIYPTWLAGAAVVLWPVGTGVAPVRHFVEFVEEQGVTVLNLPAPYWHEWVDELAHVGIPSKVRLVIAGSDKVSSEKFSAWRKHAGTRVRFCAAYGPTEGTITATIFDPAPNYVPATPCLPIGKPIARIQTHILDSAANQVADGEAGELYIGGAGLARGYLRQPELTSERFVRDPFSQKADARLYRTGDLARRLPDGNIEFLGRSDDQLKIRGFRIETGEIENALSQHPRVREPLVLGRDDRSGNKQLVAYMVVGLPRPSTQELREFLKPRLPEYMIPSAFVMLKSMPLTPGGKVDRRQLPAPEIERDSPDKAYVAPRTDTERRLVAIWEAMLDVRPIGIRDNFFELGGHSLMDARLVAEVERRMKVTLPLATIYFSRTVESLAATVERRRAQKKGSLLNPCRITGSKPPIFSHGGSTHLAKYLGEDQPIYWLDHHGTSGFGVPGTIEEMAANYVDEIRAVQPRGPYFLNGYCIGAVIILEVARQLRAAGEEIGLLSLIDPITPRILLPPRRAGAAAAVQPALRRGFFAAAAAAARARARGRYSWLKRVSKRTVCDLWIRAGLRLPVYWRDFYCDEKLNHALWCYAPKPYPGSFLLFRQPNNGTREGWRAMAQGEITFEETWINHNEMLEEPYVQILAGKLKSCLEEAQSAAPVEATADRHTVEHAPAASPGPVRQALRPGSAWIVAFLTFVSVAW